jgi:hypothetical protein
MFGDSIDSIQSLSDKIRTWKNIIFLRLTEIQDPTQRYQFTEIATTKIPQTQNDHNHLLKQITLGLSEEEQSGLIVWVTELLLGFETKITTLAEQYGIIFPLVPNRCFQAKLQEFNDKVENAKNFIVRNSENKDKKSWPQIFFPIINKLNQIVPPASSKSASPSSLSPPPILDFLPPASPSLPSPPILVFPPASPSAQAASSSSSSSSSASACSSVQAEPLVPLDECPVCLESFIRGIKLMSAHKEHQFHLFCIKCITGVFQAGYPCPLCRDPISLTKHTF